MSNKKYSTVQYLRTFKQQNVQEFYLLNIGCRNETYNLQHIKMQHIN